MAVSRLYYIPVSGEMQCRYGEIKAISRWDLKIPLRSKSFQLISPDSLRILVPFHGIPMYRNEWH